jgi:hypothetical protein
MAQSEGRGLRWPPPRIGAVCRRGGAHQTLSILDLPLPKPPPAGAEWIEAYRSWTGAASGDAF